MKQVLFLLLMLTMPILANGKTEDEKKLLERIDYMIDNDKHYQDIKEKELKHLKQLAFEAEDDKTQLLFLDSIYRAYSAYRYDSAYAYMKRGLELAQRCNDTYYITLNQINRASVLSVRGFYAKAEVLLQKLNPETMPYKLKLYYYFTFAWIYNYWESYANNSDYEEEFRTQKKHYMNLLLQSFKEDGKNSTYYHFLLGENLYLEEPTSNLTVVFILFKEVIGQFLQGYRFLELAQAIAYGCFYEIFLIEVEFTGVFVISGYTVCRHGMDA